MDKKAMRRNKYAEMPKDKKDEFLRRRRQSYTETTKKRIPIGRRSVIACEVEQTQGIPIARGAVIACQVEQTSLEHNANVSAISSDCVEPPICLDNYAVGCSTGTKRARYDKARTLCLDRIPRSAYVFPEVQNCCHCGAKRLHLESSSFCCSKDYGGPQQFPSIHGKELIC